MTQEFFDPSTVHDRDDFIRFLHWFCADRREAEEIESADPKRYQWGGANGWQNTSVTSFLEAAAAAMEQPGWGMDSGPSWRELADFFYTGKIYE